VNHTAASAAVRLPPAYSNGPSEQCYGPVTRSQVIFSRPGAGHETLQSTPPTTARFRSMTWTTPSGARHGASPPLGCSFPPSRGAGTRTTRARRGPRVPLQRRSTRVRPSASRGLARAFKSAARGRTACGSACPPRVSFAVVRGCWECCTGRRGLLEAWCGSCLPRRHQAGERRWPECG
jgi:hypothetical protein